MHIPDGPQALTAEWLTEALRTGGAIHDAKVTSFGAGPVAESTGVMGQVARLRVIYDRPELDAPGKLIAKFHSPNPGIRAQAETLAICQRKVATHNAPAEHTSCATRGRKRRDPV